MPVPIVYRKSGEQSIATYDYFDIAEGTGIKAFYPATLSGALGILTADSNVYSDLPESQGNTISDAYALQSSGAYRVTFNLPKIIKGTMYVNAPFAINTDGNQTAHAFVQAVVSKNQEV